MSNSLRPHGLQHTSFTAHHQLLEPAQTHVHQVGDAIQPSHPLSSPSPAIFPSLRVFSNESVLCMRLPKYWSFNIRMSPSSEYSGQISFRIDWLDLLAGAKQHLESNLLLTRGTQGAQTNLVHTWTQRPSKNCV